MTRMPAAMAGQYLRDPPARLALGSGPSSKGRTCAIDCGRSVYLTFRHASMPARKLGLIASLLGDLIAAGHAVHVEAQCGLLGLPPA